MISCKIEEFKRSAGDLLKVLAKVTVKVNRVERVSLEEKLASFSFCSIHIGPTITCTYAATHCKACTYLAKLFTQDYTLANVVDYCQVVAETRATSYLIHSAIIIVMEGI